MTQDKFQRRQVDRSFRKFNDTTRDLFQAHFNAWSDTFNHMLDHCEHDPVMQVITEPLKANHTIDVQKWYEDALRSIGSMIGTGSYELPRNDDDRTALLFQFFLMLRGRKVDLRRFCMGMYGSSQYQEMVSTFNRELVQKFTREVSYRLNEIVEDIGDQQEVSRDAMVVFHHHDNSVNFHAAVQGSNVAIGGSTVADSNATFMNHEELAKALKALKPMIGEIAAEQTDAVTKALDLLVRATHDESVTVEQAKEATQIIAEVSPTLRDRLKDISGKVAVSLLTSTIVLGVKAYFHIP